MNRYQKPEVFEKLAMEYALGTMHGRARKRFERLMEQHPFIASVVEEKSLKMAELIEFLPEEKPADHVWANISQQISNTTSATSETTQDVQVPWWQWLVHKGFVTAAVLLIVSSVILLRPGADVNPTAYTATLFSESSEPMVEVVAQKTDMKMMVKMMEPVHVPDGMQMNFWCIAKDKTKPVINMGTLQANGMTEVELKLNSWQGIVDAAMFAISIEPAGTNNSTPTGDVIFTGKLKALTNRT